MAVVYGALLLVLAIGPALSEGQELSLNQETQQRLLLRRERPSYQNYAFDHYAHYPDHTWSRGSSNARQGIGPERPQALWSPLGDYVMTGYDLFFWTERRQAEQRFGSELFKDWGSWHHEFINVMVAKDGYRDWGYSAIVGDGLIARFTPLTLSMTDFNGTRVDVSLPQLKLTALGSRIARPNREHPLARGGQVEDDLSTMLLGSRVQADIGPLHLGVNGVNLHAYDSTKLNNSIKGQLRIDQPQYSWLIVRVTDDEPTDGRAGAMVQDVVLMINGQPRPDLQPQVIRHRADVPSQVGRTLNTGRFLPTGYNNVIKPCQFCSTANRYYQNEQIPLFADYIYLVAHGEGEDVSMTTNLDELLNLFSMESPATVQLADGDEQLIYLFDMRQEPQVESVEVEAVLGNDYRVDWAGVYLNQSNATAPKIEDRFRATFYRTGLRARDSVEDGSNLKRVRFKVGENTAIFTYSADMHLALPGLVISGEYARSAVYGRYPANIEGQLLPSAGPRFANRGSAYFANATHWFGGGRIGMEYFSMNPDFTTEMEAYLFQDSGYRVSTGGGTYSPYGGLSNDTVIWRLVQDNEDGDRWPDYSLGVVLGSPRTPTEDGDGIFPGQDDNNDGIPDTNRNDNDIPDYEEDFLLYEVEPNEYFYGQDRNNNDEPDQREDDWDVDYPYDPDQRGYHLFGQLDLSNSWSAGVGRYAIEGLASGGRNRSSYFLLGYRRQGVARLQRLFFENHLRRVQDDIPDAFRFTGGSGVLARRSGRDPLFYQDSYVNETYLEGQLRPWPRLNLVQKLRLRLNWQQGGRLPNSRFQRARRLDFWTVVSRVDYTLHWGNLRVTPQFKYLYSRLQDQRASRTLVFEYRIVPIIKVAYPLMSRTSLQAGVQGWGPLPYRVKNRTQKQESFEQRTAVFSVTNRSRYLGYDLHTIIGFQRRNRQFDDPFQRFREFNTWEFFMRGLVGFTEYGRVI